MEKKVRTKKTPLTVTSSGVAGHDSKALLDLIEAEGSMSANDKLQEDTNEAKNALEAYTYSLRNKLYENLGPYVQEVSSLGCWMVVVYKSGGGCITTVTCCQHSCFRMEVGCTICAGARRRLCAIALATHSAGAWC
jgi:hypothetical protein